MKKHNKRSLLSCIKGYWKETILAPVTVAFEVVIEIIIPLVMSDIINTVDRNQDGSIGKLTILKFLSNMSAQKGAIIGSLILICLAIVSLTFGALAGMYAARAAAGYAKNLRQAIYYSVQEFSFENIDKFQTSSLITRCTTDVTNVQNSFMMIIRTAVRAPFMLIFAFVMSMTIKPSIAIVFVYVTPILALALFVIMKLAHRKFKVMFVKYDRLNTVVQENVAGARTVKAFVREDTETEKFKAASKGIYDYSAAAEKILAFNNPFMQAAIYSCFLVVSYLSAKQITVGNLTTGELNSLLTYIMQILMSLMMLSMILVMITMSKASKDRISEILNEEPTIKNCDNPIYNVENGSIEFKNVSFGYKNALADDKLVLKDINVSIPSGATVGIVGGTGSAKSTLVNLIPRLYDITSGELLIGGKNIKDYDIVTLRDEVSVVLQKNVLFSGTINSNLRWGNKDATEEELKHASMLAQADEFVSRFPDKYESHIEQGGANVSGGQRQRLCIARALVKKPKILILDDSTSAVDTKTDALIRKAFKEEIPNTTKIIIAQRISSIEDADMIIVLDDGKINGIGTHEELLKNNEIYSEVYTSQVKGAGANASE